MNPYLTVPIALPGDEGVNNPDKTVSGKILPANVIAYHEGYSWGTFIYLFIYQPGKLFVLPAQ